jgi:hypothetical protein
MHPPDTTPAAQARQRDVFRRMTPEQRVALAAEMSDEIRAVTEAGIRHRHPEWTDDEVQAELARIVLGPALAKHLRTHTGAPSDEPR